jgi:ADP-ribose pyrophosphatase
MTSNDGVQNEVWIQSRTLYDGAIVRLQVGEVRLDDGTVASREVVHHPGGVAVVALIEDRVVLIRQFRIAIGREIVEIPAGKLEGTTEDTEDRGRAELEEETGYRAGRMVYAGSVYASVGYTSEEIHFYLAFDLEKTRQRLDTDERIGVFEMPLAEVRRRLSANEFKDAKTVVGLERLFDYLERQPMEGQGT